MKKEHYLMSNTITLDFGVAYCDSSKKLLESNLFSELMDLHIAYLKRKNDDVYVELFEILGADIKDELINIAKMLMIMKKDEVFATKESWTKLKGQEKLLIEFIETLYSYWRSFERYAKMKTTKRSNSLQDLNFVKANDDLASLVLKVYRRIEENLMEKTHSVYRQVEAGVNAGILTKDCQWTHEKFPIFTNIDFIETIILRPPFITYPKQNTRKGYFEEVMTNPLDGLMINKDEFLCYPTKVGKYLTFVYFHKNYMAHGLALANLFEMATIDEIQDVKPDMVYLFGAESKEEGKTVFYHDKDSDIHIGLATAGEAIDYFGYMKKMMLTLHNVRQISEGNLPIHGAFANIKLRSGIEKNIMIIGDSGAGKSETLEMLQTKFDEEIKKLNVIFDDMGVLSLKSGATTAYGTEIGAFVRLDDLDSGYAYKEIDRAIFMNPDKINARLVIPIATYETIMQGFKPDLVLYANNYTDSDAGISFFDTPNAAVDIYKRGMRGAKGTTSETGIVESYFANPFGPYQKQTECDVLIDEYFAKMFAEDIKVGELYTKLAISGFEHAGPAIAAEAIMKFIKDEM